MDFFTVYLPIAGMPFNVLLLLLIGFTVTQYRLVDGHCPQCQAAIPGRWHTAATLPHLQHSSRARVTPLRW